MNLKNIMSATILASSLACATLNPSYEVTEKRKVEAETCYTRTRAWLQKGGPMIYNYPPKYLVTFSRDEESFETNINEESFGRLNLEDKLSKRQIKKLRENYIYRLRPAKGEEIKDLPKCKRLF
jgi:hypothetical protein